MIVRSPMMHVMTAAAIKAGKAIMRDFSELDKLQVSRKGTADFATNADRRAEKILLQELGKARPSYSILTEESGEIPGSDATQRFVIDPIDGTHNFIHALPYFCIAVAYERQRADGKFETQAGVIYDPIQNELFCAELNQGATLNDQRLRVSGRTDTDLCMLATFLPSSDASSHSARMYAAMTASPFLLRASGSTALDLAYVAAGRYDGACFVSYKHWDVAAALLILREAGGQIAESGKEDRKLLIAGNQAVYTKLESLLRV